MIDRLTANRMAARFGLSAVAHVVPVSGGVINRSSVFLLADGSQWVCRVDVGNQPTKLERERSVYRWLAVRAPDLPIADAFHLDGACDLIERQYALLPRLPGENLGAHIERLPEAVRRPLLVSVGALLRRLHDIPDNDEHLVDPHHRGQPWRDFCLTWFDRVLARCRSALGYTPFWADRAIKWMNDSIARLPEFPPRVFLHGDFHFGNMQYEAAPVIGVSGIFDFEWAWSGHAACDWLHLEEAAVTYPAYQLPLFEGYGISAWPQELSVYRLIQSVGVLGAAAVEPKEPLWDLMAWHASVIENVVHDRPAFSGLLRASGRGGRFSRGRGGAN